MVAGSLFGDVLARTIALHGFEAGAELGHRERAFGAQDVGSRDRRRG